MKGSCSPPYPLTPPPPASPQPPPRSTHLESPEGRGEGAWSRGITFQPPSPSSRFQSGQGLREMGTGSTKLLPTAEGLAPECVLWNSQALLPECSWACSWAPSYGIPFPLFHRPFRVSALWPGPPRSEGRQGKGKVTQTLGKQIQGYMFREVGSIFSIYAK